VPLYNGVLAKINSCLMKGHLLLIVCILLAGCSPTEEGHIREVRAAVAKAGGSSAILAQSRILFSRLTNETESVTLNSYGKTFDGLSGITSLGDVFSYDPKNTTLPDRVVIRRYNSHRDTYFIQFANPEEFEKSDLKSFRRIVGNVGFIE